MADIERREKSLVSPVFTETANGSFLRHTQLGSLSDHTAEHIRLIRCFGSAVHIYLVRLYNRGLPQAVHANRTNVHRLYFRAA